MVRDFIWEHVVKGDFWDLGRREVVEEWLSVLLSNIDVFLFKCYNKGI